MPKIQLGSPPATFPHTVKYQLLDGGTDEIKVQYVYRTREQFAEFVAEMYPEQPLSIEMIGGRPSVVTEAAKARERDVAYILKTVKSWDLAEEFNEANVRRLVNEFVAAATQMISDYSVAITEGRLKN